jgi:hypothetical protein
MFPVFFFFLLRNTNSDSESENNVYDLLSCHKVEDSFFSENPPDSNALNL